MASNLLKAGHPLVVCDVYPAPVQKLVLAGAREAKTPKEVAQHAKKIVTMLPSSPHVQVRNFYQNLFFSSQINSRDRPPSPSPSPHFKEVYLGKNGIAEWEGVRGTLAIDASTIDPSASREVAEALHAKGMMIIDAPVSGGVMGAQNGTLTFMVGGPKDTVDLATPILELMGKKIVHCGPSGNGQVVKVRNWLPLWCERVVDSHIRSLMQGVQQFGVGYRDDRHFRGDELGCKTWNGSKTDGQHIQHFNLSLLV